MSIKTFRVHDEEKWMHQNGARYTGAFYEGCLLDNYVLDCKRGYVAVYERYVTPNSSEHVFKFAPYKDREACDSLWHEFYERYDENERRTA